MSELLKLVADLSDHLTDEGADYTPEGLDNMRRRVANALPGERCPDWLRRYRDPIDPSLRLAPEEAAIYHGDIDGDGAIW